jgi:hypothetical protein
VLRPDEGDVASGEGAGAADGGAFGQRRCLLGAVEDEQRAVGEAEPVEIGVELDEALLQRVGLAGAADLEFHPLPLLGAGPVRAGVRPADQHVHNTTACGKKR